MTIAVKCPACGRPYSLKDEMAGHALACAKCGSTIQVPGEEVAPLPQADPVFDRDKFLLRQKAVAIDAKYAVFDEHGQRIVYIVRPAHLLQNLGALLAGLIVAGLIWGFGITAADAAGPGALAAVFGVLVMLGGLVALFALAVGLSAKRHVTFYRDQSKREVLLETLQDRKWQPITATYTVRTPGGDVIARFSKNYLFNLIRKRWYVDGPEGRLCVAKEDSIILSILRRLFGPLFGLLRTNFVILRGATEEVIGEFNRKLTILDRYVLDMSPDRGRTLDRRIALALGVMLDTGERR